MTGPPPYAELHSLSNYSFLVGASHPEELVERAAELGYTALAITDQHTLAGVVRAHQAAREAGLKLILGAELHLRDAPPLLLWASHRAAYGRLCRLLTLGRRRAPKGECRLTFDDLARHAEGLLAGVLPMTPEGEPLPLAESDSPDSTRNPAAVSLEGCRRYRELFGDRVYLVAEAHRGPDDAARLHQLAGLAARSGLPLLAAGGARYHHPARLALHHTLAAIRARSTVAAVLDRTPPNAQRHLRPRHDLARLFAAHPEALARSVEAAERCRFSLEELRYEYPEELAPAGRTPREYLAELTWRGAAERYPAGTPVKVRRQVEHELALIGELEYEAYFLTVHDLIRFARSRGILCQGRGSAANSAVCYCLGVTAVDPARTDLLFERFVSRERREAPDIDIDFEHERREEVLQYLFEKYGRDRAGMTAVTITYRLRSAVRDVGKALGLSLDLVDALAKNMEPRQQPAETFPERCREAGLDPRSRVGAQFVRLVGELAGFPRHLSQHVGGMVITRGPLEELVPIENAAMPGRTVIQWNKDDLDALGMLKVDCLGLGMLTALRKCFALVERHHGRALSLAALPEDDPRVYDMICAADTVGVFQIESRAQMSMLPRLRPRTWYDLVIEVAIVRPGPIQGQMVHPYLRRRCGEEPVQYPNAAIRQVLEKTLGVPIFQEQAMRLAVVAAGFTPGEADELRRAMGAWRRTGKMEQFRRKLLRGMLASGLSFEFAEQVYRQIRGFGEYGFPESHAASFALLVYASAWLKHYYPAAYCAAILNSQPMGFYAPAQLLADARKHGVPVLPIEANHSAWDCTLEHGGETPALRLGLRLVSGLGAAEASRLIAARTAAGPFSSQHELVRRTGLGRSALERLAEADALASLGRDRRQALWDALAAPPAGRREQPLLASLPADDEPPVELPNLSPFEQVLADYRTVELSLRGHPLEFFREPLEDWGIVSAKRLAELPHGSRVRVAGVVLLRQRPSTAKGITFVTLEDETGTINLILHPGTWERFRRVARHSQAWIARGPLQRHEQVTHVVVEKLEDLTERLKGLRVKSRDFQ